MTRTYLLSMGLRTVAVALLAPVLLVAAPKVCERGEPTPESYTWEFPREASELLAEMEMHASALKRHADQLTSFAWNTQISWQSHAQELTYAKERMNRMGEILCRLEVIHHVTAPWQREATFRIRSMIETAASRTEAAIEFLNENQMRLFQPQYRAHVEGLHDEAGEIAYAVNAYLSYDRADARLQRLRES